MSTQKSTKIGENRGRARVWLQGAVLTEAGFQVGDLFTAKITPGRLVIELVTSSKPLPGMRTVTGKGAVPIVDIAGLALLTVAPLATRLSIKRTKQGKLILKPEAK